MNNKIIRATILVVGRLGASQALRLGGNLITTRLLAPELFGVMAIVSVVLFGLGLFSDIGLGPGIIRSKRSNDPSFLDTAWTLQAIRGGVLWLFTLIIAFPVAKIYEAPDLLWLVPVSGLSFLLTGFYSTALHTLNKQMRLGRITALQLITQIMGLLIMILVAYFYRNIWALVFGTLVTSLATLVGSHFLDPSHRNRFNVEKEVVYELISFGKWVFFSTAMMFLATQSDRFLLGKLMPLALFGVYNIAITFAELPKQVLLGVTNLVLFPVLVGIAELPRPDFRKKVLNARVKILVPLLVLVVFLAVFGDILIALLYDQRYHEAGWMLPLLALGMWPFILNASIDRCFYAISKPKIPAIGNLFKFLYMVISVPLLFRYAGVIGSVLAVAFNDLPVYLVIGFGLKKEGLACFRQDIFFTVLLIGGVGICCALRYFSGFGLPSWIMLGNL